MTKKAIEKPAPIKPATTTTTRPKYYRTLDIFFYCLYCLAVVVVIGLSLRVYKYNANLEEDWANFYNNIMIFIGVCMFILTLVFIGLAFTTKYNVMYTLLHHELFKASEKEKFGTYKQVSFQM